MFLHQLLLQPQHANLRQSEVRNTMMGYRDQVRKSDASRDALLNITKENVAPSIENRRNSVGRKPDSAIGVLSRHEISVSAIRRTALVSDARIDLYHTSCTNQPADLYISPHTCY